MKPTSDPRGFMVVDSAPTYSNGDTVVPREAVAKTFDEFARPTSLP
jgi:hypothetical protein